MKRKHMNPILVIKRKLNSFLRKKPKDINPKLLETGMRFSLAISKIRLENNMVTKEEFKDDLVSQILDVAGTIEKSVGNINTFVIQLGKTFEEA